MLQEFDKAVAIVNERVDPLRRFAVVNVERQYRDFVDAGERLPVHAVHVGEATNAGVEPLQLGQADGGLEIRELEVEPDTGMNVVAACSTDRPALILQFAKSHHQALIARDHEAALARRDRLVRREREAAGLAEGAEPSFAVTRAQRLRRVLDDGDPMRGGDV